MEVALIEHGAEESTLVGILRRKNILDLLRLLAVEPHHVGLLKIQRRAFINEAHRAARIVTAAVVKPRRPKHIHLQEEAALAKFRSIDWQALLIFPACRDF